MLRTTAVLFASVALTAGEKIGDYTLYEGKDFLGGDLAWDISTDNKEECADVCKNWKTGNCIAWTWHGWGGCFPKTTKGDQPPADVEYAVSGWIEGTVPKDLSVATVLTAEDFLTELTFTSVGNACCRFDPPADKTGKGANKEYKLSLAECEAKCGLDDGCGGYEYSTNGKCEIHENTPTYSEKGGACSHCVAKSGSSAELWKSTKDTVSYLGNDDKCEYVEGRDFLGGPDIPGKINMPVADAETCGGLCMDVLACSHFSYSYGYCFLKSGGMAPIVSTSVVSGECTKPQPVISGCNLEFGVNYWGASLAGFEVEGHMGPQMADPTDCAELCSKETECTHFSHVFGTCYLKTSSGTATDLIDLLVSTARRDEPAHTAVSGVCKAALVADVVVVTEAPATEAPATEAPATEAPATEAPATEAPATEAPATEAPATQETPVVVTDVATCEDSLEWAQAGKIASKRGCAWVGYDRATRCTKEDNNGVKASTSCPVACNACPGTETPGTETQCANSATWYKKNKEDKSDKSKDCDWVARKPEKRCKSSVKGKDKTKAKKSCPLACGKC